MIHSVALHRWLLISIISVSVILSLLCLGLMTAEYDEAWIIASARQAMDAGAIPQVEPVTTTGGIYFLLMSLSAKIDMDPVLLARSISFVSAVLLFGLIYRSLGRWYDSHTEKLIPLITCLAAPGTILLTGMGFGITLALLLFVAGMLVVTRGNRITLPQALLAGLLIGAAMATRWTLIPALPSLLLLAIGHSENRRSNLIAAMLAGATAIVVLVGFVTLQVSMLDGTGPNSGVSLSSNARAAGVTVSLPNLSRLLGYITSIITVFPIALLVIAAVSCLSIHENRQLQRTTIIFAGAAALITLALLMRTPAMLLRYIWPAYFMMSLSAGLGLAVLYRKALDNNVRSLALLAIFIPVSLAVTQMIISLRLIAIGAATQVNSAGYENLSNHYRPFYLHQEEAEITRFLEQTPPGTVLATVAMPREHSALELSLVGQRNVHDFGRFRERLAGVEPDLFIVHRFSPFNDQGRAWLETLGTPVAQIKGYTVFPFPDNATIPENDSIILEMQLYRFGPEKWLSLTGW